MTMVADVQFYIFCRYLMFNFVFVDFNLILLNQKILFCDGQKEKVRRVYSEKNTKLCRNLKRLSLIKMLLLNVTYQEAAYIEEKLRKIQGVFKTLSLSR